ncbi:hypothetical protein [Sunxiuqinia indica]|uniref:hypothetical protein n=1 Tax=Sunxiuqinia indica TaxID=2692584 RepID=UPI00135BCCB4|nr:hypothetical protein [Sunxiuqinia indica]
MRNIIITFGLIVLISCNSNSKSDSEQTQDVYIPETDTSIYESSTVEKIIEENKPQTNYSLTYWDSDTLNLWGHQPLDKHLFLINFNSGQVHKAKTTLHISKEDEIIDLIELTKIEPAIFEDKRDLDLAIFSDKEMIDFKLLKFENLNNESLSSEIDSLIRETSMIDSLLKINGNELDNSVITSTPIISELKIDNVDIKIATYMIFDNSTTGPRIAFLNGKIYPISGQCSFKELIPYLIDNELYIKTGASCCDCGIVIDKIYKITNDSILLKFNDGSQSM